MNVQQHRVAVLGSRGRTGAVVCEALEEAPDMQLVARPRRDEDLSALLGTATIDTIVDFTAPDSVMATLESCIGAGVHAVVGTSGFDRQRLETVAEWVAASAHPVGVLIAPNFSIGAALMMRFAARAAAYYESVEVIDLHHAGKTDAPSGTALHTANVIASARRAANVPEMPDATNRELEGARGANVDSVRVHSIRMAGLIGHQEVVLGTAGELLTIRHDSLDRASFVPGVLLALRNVRDRPGLTVGIDQLLQSIKS